MKSVLNMIFKILILFKNEGNFCVKNDIGKKNFP